jgi:hypothetical protein
VTGGKDTPTFPKPPQPKIDPNRRYGRVCGARRQNTIEIPEAGLHGRAAEDVGRRDRFAFFRPFAQRFWLLRRFELTAPTLRDGVVTSRAALPKLRRRASHGARATGLVTTP